MLRLEVAPVLAPAALDLAAAFAMSAAVVALAATIWLTPRVQNMINPNTPIIGGIWKGVTGFIFQSLFDALALGVYAMAEILNKSATFAHWFIGLFGSPANAVPITVGSLQQEVDSIIRAFNTYVNKDLADLRSDVDSIINAFNTYVNADLATLRKDVNSILDAFNTYVNKDLAQLRIDVDSILNAFTTYVNKDLAQLRTDVDAIFLAFNTYVNATLAQLTAWQQDVIKRIIPGLIGRIEPLEQTVGELAPLVAAGALTAAEAVNLRNLADDTCYCLNFGMGQDLTPAILFLLYDME